MVGSLLKKGFVVKRLTGDALLAVAGCENVPAFFAVIPRVGLYRMTPHGDDGLSL
jgi:hypothetical protein